jgi:putative peptidoglycan lipid II flippase
VVATSDEPRVGGDDLNQPGALDSRGATVRSAAMMSGGTLLSRGTGLVRVAVMAAALGATALGDTYNIANTTPNIVYELVLGGILTSVFVPVLVEWAKTHGTAAMWEAGSRFLTFVLVVLTGVTIVGIVFAPTIMRFYLSGDVGKPDYADQVELGTFFLRWFLPQIVFYGLGAVAAGLLTANRRFAAQMYAPVLNNLAVIVTMIAFIWIRPFTRMPIDAVTHGQRLLLAAGTTLGVVAMTLALWPSLRGLGFRWHLRFDWRHETTRRLVRLARWVVVYVAANQVAYFLIIRFTSHLAAGAYTTYSYAFIFFSLPHAIVAVSIFTALLPGLAGRWTDRDLPGVRELYSQGMRDTLIVMIPAAAGYVVLAGPIVALIASYGAMQVGDTDLLARTLAAFAVGLPFFSAFQLLTRSFYATHDSRTPALANIVVAVVNLLVDIWLAFGLGLGVPGLALGYAASYVAGTAILSFLLSRRLEGADGRRIASTIARTVGAAAFTAAAAWATAAAVAGLVDVGRPLMRLLQVALAVMAGVLAFAAGALIFRIQEADEVRRALAARFRR